MKAVIQRVSQSCVKVNGDTLGQTSLGLVILLGIEEIDNRTDVEWLAKKVIGLRIFSDEHGKMNLNIEAAGGELLVISQFTLHASTKKGTRPSFIKAARPEQAIPLYEAFIDQGFNQSNNVANLGEDERQFTSEITIKVLGYLIGEGNSDDRPIVIREESIVEIAFPRETVVPAGNDKFFLD